MPKAKQTAVAKKEPANLQRPDFLPQKARGLEEADRNDITLPRLAVCQSMTPQRKKTNPEFIEGLNEGDLFNTITGQIYGTELDVVALFMFKSRIKFNPMDSGGGIDCSSPNGKTGGMYSPKSCEACEFSQWIQRGEGKAASNKPLCTNFQNYAVILPDFKRELLVLSLKSTGIRVAKNWNAMMKLRNADTFAGLYKITVQSAAGKGDTEYEAIKVSNAGWVDENLFKYAEQAYTGLKGKEIKVDMTGEGGEPGDAVGGDVPF